MKTRQKITEAAILKRPSIKRPRHRNTQAHHANNNSAKRRHDHRKNRKRRRKRKKSHGWTSNSKHEKTKKGRRR